MDARIYTLVHKELTGEISPTEAAELSQLRSQDGASQLSEDVSLIWNVSKDYFPRQDWNAGSAKAQFLNKIRADKAPATSISQPVITAADGNTWWKWAIAAVALTGLAYLIYTNTINTTSAEDLHALEDIQFATLDDNTKVWLSEGSSLTAISVDGAKRAVNLEGDAVFDVSHDPDRTFTIRLGEGIMVDVLGTSFKVSSAHGDGTGQVSVRDGKVRLYSTKGETYNLTLVAGETGKLNVRDLLINKVYTDQPVTLGDIQSLRLTDLSLAQAFPKLAAFYGLEIDMTEATVTDCQFSSTLAGQPRISDIFQAIQEVHPTINIEVVGRSKFKVSGACQ